MIVGEDSPKRRAKMLASEDFNTLALGWHNRKGLSKQVISITVDNCENDVHGGYLYYSKQEGRLL